MKKTGWEIKSIDRSPRNGRFYVRGLNHETTDPLFREFSWHVQDLGDRFWMAEDCVVSEAAQALLEADNA